MPLQDWSENIVIAELHDEPDFSEDTDLIKVKLDESDHFDLILDLTNVTKLNSSNLGALVEIHKKMITRKNYSRITFLVVKILPSKISK